MPLLTHDSATGEFELTVELHKSTDLQTFLPLSFGDTTTTIAPDGRLKIRFAVPDDAAFFRLQSQ